MQIEDFNEASSAEAAALVRPCAAIDSWVQALVAHRPYADVDALVERAGALAARWTDEEVEQALADHPRIGEKHHGGGPSAAMSAREQGTVPSTADVQERLAAGNAAYEARFDRIFLVRASGRTAEEVLAQLDERLGNDPATELDVTRGQLAEIAALRLRGVFA